ncbi:progesterone receptor isoform X1 [Dunckerocampus dactyliophorus]|uniref:progesterone receptor isoform X1 n=1 Tax=Dunckerocampus dactyliophorus TaxID=161453 RepID=UPI0024052980|nr:progesterone receptor isoform X1 [Dunckerocampus dactyliophorus]
MEPKVHSRMGSVSDSTDIIEGGYTDMKPPSEPQSSYGDAAAASRQSVSSSGDAFLLEAPRLYQRADFLKCDSSPWDHFVKVQEPSLSASESLDQAGTGSSLAPPAAACKFIKDEQEASVIMDAACPTFDQPPDALVTCCQGDRKQTQFGFGDLEYARFAPVGPRPTQESSPNFLSQLNQAEQQRGALPGKGTFHLDPTTPAHPAVYKSEVPRWQVPLVPAEPQFWCQPTEDQFTQAYNGVHAPAMVHRNQTPFSAFHGMSPQRSCVICGDEASGCHYGVLTCGSCKVFFKRAVEGHHSYLCAGRNDCIVDKIRRKNCPACRLRKCYQAGMMLGGRKLKRFGAFKALGLAPPMMFQSHVAMSGDNQALTSAACISGIHEVPFSQQIMGILENIEPEMVYSGYDTSQADIPHLLLNRLNELCEKQLLWIVKWSKSLPGFRNLHINDQMTLIQYSWMNLMVFSLGWRSFQNVTREFLYFAPDLVLSQEQMRRSPIYDLCLAIQFIPQEFANLQVTREEFLCMKAIILLNTVPLEGLKSQSAFEEMRQNYIRELSKAMHVKEKSVMASSQRFYHLTKLMDAMHEIVKKVNLFCLSTFIQADAMNVEFPEMMSEVIASQLPKVLAGMVRPLLFHPK